jgi:hypothetical protein
LGSYLYSTGRSSDLIGLGGLMHLVVGLQLGLLLLAELRETQRRFGDRIAMGPLLLTPQSFLKLNFAIMDRLPLLLQPLIIIAAKLQECD